MKGALIYEWRKGASEVAPDLKSDLSAYFERAESDGRVDGFRWFASGKGDRAFLIVDGDTDALGRLTEDGALVALKTRIQLSHADYEWHLCMSS
jgi:hypothetical protein